MLLYHSYIELVNDNYIVYFILNLCVTFSCEWNMLFTKILVVIPVQQLISWDLKSSKFCNHCVKSGINMVLCQDSTTLYFMLFITVRVSTSTKYIIFFPPVLIFVYFVCFSTEYQQKTVIRIQEKSTFIWLKNCRYGIKHHI